jgi:hypothetical protein
VSRRLVLSGVDLEEKQMADERTEAEKQADAEYSRNAAREIRDAVEEARRWEKRLRDEQEDEK